jgi:hypothetical protein
MTDTTDPAPTPTKPGYKTTEFWLSMLATLLTALFASGALTNNVALAIAGMAATVLTALGYKVSRTLVKTAGALLLAGLLVAPQIACSSARQRGSAAAGAFLDCQAPNLIPLLPDAIAIAKSAVMRWIAGDGHVDLAGIKADAAPLKSDLGRCAFDAAIAALAVPTPAAPGAPAAAALAIDGAGLRTGWAATRGELGWPPEAS